MKNLTAYITEKLKLKNVKKYNYHPTYRLELQELVGKLIKERGQNANLNDIDTSEITNMSFLFNNFYEFNGDISQWDVSNVTDMESMFSNCTLFNGDLSQWDVSKVEYMEEMFFCCNSFEGKGLDKWDVSNVITLDGTFYRCRNFIGKEIENWDVSNVKKMNAIFYMDKKLDCNLSKWNPKKCLDFTHMFYKCENIDGNLLSNWKNIIHSYAKINDMFDQTKTLPNWYIERLKRI